MVVKFTEEQKKILYLFIGLSLFFLIILYSLYAFGYLDPSIHIRDSIYSSVVGQWMHGIGVVILAGLITSFYFYKKKKSNP